jgi:hypothetical protein
MPRSRPGAASPTFPVHSFPLEDGDRNKLLEALGFDLIDPANRGIGTLALLDVELLLGAYPGLVANVEKA